MKRRRLKKSVKVLLFLVIFIGLVIVGLNIIDGKPKKKEVDDVPKNNLSEDKNHNEEPTYRIKLAMVGDVLIHKAVYLDADTGNGNYDFSHMFEYIPDLVKGYDLKYFNQESTIGGKSIGISGYPSFNSPDEIGNTMVDLGFNMVSLANNHALDRGTNAINYSVNYWNSKDGVIKAGSYASLDDRNEVKIYEENGIKFAFLSYTTSSNANPDNNYSIVMYSDMKAKDDVEAAKAAGADLVIVAMHWGQEYTNNETESQVRIAEYLSSLGVNLIIGTHPHVIQPIKYIGDTLVIYSLGNFISNQFVLDDGVNKGTGLFVGVDIVLTDDGKIKFENLNYELLLQYSENNTDDYNNSRNFKVIPYSKLTNDLLPNYERHKSLLSSYVERYMKI